MDMTYKNMLNNFAFNVMPHTAVIPDYRLCIGDAERLENIPLLLFKDVSAPMQKPKFIDIKTEPIEKFGQIGDGNYIEADDFENDNFFESINVGGVV